MNRRHFFGTVLGGLAWKLFCVHVPNGPPQNNIPLPASILPADTTIMMDGGKGWFFPFYLGQHAPDHAAWERARAEWLEELDTEAPDRRYTLRAQDVGSWPAQGGRGC